MTLFLGASAYAQRTVSGSITEDDGTPLIGATVQVKGTGTGTVTDLDGNFTVDVPGDDAILVVSYTGYETLEIAVSSQSTMAIKMSQGISLDEIVVTGYSVDNRRQTTGAVSTIKTKDLTVVPSGNVEQQLQGRAAGVTVITNGQPGTSSIVRVRGFGAFGGNEPLYIVDGVPVGSTDFLSPDDIESTTILKDAASASIYGARAANGVIVYTTKKGKKKPQPLTISYDALYGVTTPGTGQTMLNPTEQAEWTWNAIRNQAIQNNTTPTFSHPQYGTGNTPIIPDYINVGGASGVTGSVDLNAEKAKYNVDPTVGAIYQVVKANKAGTDWYDAITRNAPLTRHSLGFQGSSDKARYYIGLSYQDQSGILTYNEFKRRSFRANTEFDLSPNVRIGENLQFTYRQVLGLSGGSGGRGINQDENDILSAFRMPPIIPVYDEFGGYAGTAAKGFNNPRNPVASRDGQANNSGFNGNGFGNVYIEVDLLPDLTLKSSLGGQYNNFFSKSYTRLQYENSENNASFGYGESSSYGFSYSFTNTANYKQQFGAHSIDLLAGVEALNTGLSYFTSSSGLNPFSTNPDYINLSTVGNDVVNSGFSKGVNFFSYFGKANYSYNDKYYVTGVIRRDGSSRFGENNRYGVFPAVSAAWQDHLAVATCGQKAQRDQCAQGGRCLHGSCPLLLRPCCGPSVLPGVGNATQGHNQLRGAPTQACRHFGIHQDGVQPVDCRGSFARFDLDQRQLLFGQQPQRLARNRQRLKPDAPILGALAVARQRQRLEAGDVAVDRRHFAVACDGAQQFGRGGGIVGGGLLGRLHHVQHGAPADVRRLDSRQRGNALCPGGLVQRRQNGIAKGLGPRIRLNLLVFAPRRAADQCQHRDNGDPAILAEGREQLVAADLFGDFVDETVGIAHAGPRLIWNSGVFLACARNRAKACCGRDTPPFLSAGAENICAGAPLRLEAAR